MSANFDETLDHVSSDTIDHVTEISDPGERDRAHHIWGDRLVVQVGNVAAWLFPILMIAIISQVLLRKAGHNQAWLDDLQWWLYGAALLTGFAYAITTESHVRVDIFHANFAPAKKARIELFALGWCLLPFLILLTDNMIHYAATSIGNLEGSTSPNGLHMLYLLKALLPVLLIVAIIAATSAMVRHMKTLRAPALWNMLLAGLPAAWFFAERICYYVVWWVVRLMNPDMNSRKVAKSDLLEPSMWYGLGTILILIAVSFALTRRNKAEV